MNAFKVLKKRSLVLTGILFFAANLSAQTENPPINLEKPAEIKTAPTLTPTVAPTTETPTAAVKTEIKPDAKPENTAPPVKPEIAAATVENKPAVSPTANDKKADESDEAAQVIPYYNNYLAEYRLGPNDVISVEVFGQCPDYCKLGIAVPPTARISYPLIREGILVGGKTVEEVAAEVTKKLDEYIIDPKVTVTLEKAMSVRYSVMGKVVTPGIRVMDRKVSLYEAILEAGGIAKDGNKKKISLVRFDTQGKLTRQDVNLTEIETGKTPMIYLNPGDQVFVSGKGFTVDKFFDYLGKASVARLLFSGGL